MHRRHLTSSAAAAALVLGVLAVTGPAGAAASNHLRSDASGALTRADGFLGVPAAVSLDDPAVTSTTSVAAAADAHLARYGAEAGLRRPGTTWVQASTQPAVTGDVVRYQQHVGGLPVYGGELVMNLREDRELASVLTATTDAATVGAAELGEAAAAQVARARFAKVAGAGAAPTVEGQGRWVVDPALAGLSSDLGVRTGWRFALSRAADERRDVVVDDRTGAVLLDASTVKHLERVVCDNESVELPEDGEESCTSGYARAEGDPASPVADVNAAYDHAEAASDTYASLGVDLTDLIGLEQEDGSTAIASTVRICYDTEDGCPLENAFWNGEEMYYGEDEPLADDTVGHELTHGVIDRTSALAYFGESGAINESIADIMGEIVDRQYVTASDTTATEWVLFEDTPSTPNGIRNMKNPPAFEQPDKMSSSLYEIEDPNDDGVYDDEDGVHTNSGVGNKAAYLISAGGSFNGQSITGIDAGDPSLSTSAELWLLVTQSLTSGSGYDDLGRVLQQSCATLQTAGVTSAADCESVHRAVVATEMQTVRPGGRPADAPMTCPAGTTLRVLFDSETLPDVAAAFDAEGGWSRDGIDGFGQAASSGTSAWAGRNLAQRGQRSLTSKAAYGVALPAGQSSYLWFQHWRAFEYADTDAGRQYYDGGTVEIRSGAGPADAADLPWVNGPTQTLATTNPLAGRKAFAGDSRGYLASRADLTGLAGKTVRPQFTLASDDDNRLVGWFVDDLRIYTCDVPTGPTNPPATPGVTKGSAVLDGKARVGKKLTAEAVGWGPAPVALTYQWLRNGKVVAGATSSTYKLKKKDQGKRMSVVVTGTKQGYTAAAATSAETKKVKRKPRTKKG